jgi:hypothetical protein
VQGGVTPPSGRDRDPAGRPRNARPRDRLGRPLPRGATPAAADDVAALAPTQAINTAQHLLDRGEPFTAHEVFEAVWKASAGDQRDLWRGLAQLCVGITHALRGNTRGARTLLLRAADTLEPYVGLPAYDLDVAGLVAWARGTAKESATSAEVPRLVMQRTNETEPGSRDG